ncbi:hypothetical protein M9H77_03644 [Catharanthus roseus]|uniref:Uncharacterized protein n=1 Tax=Catharanthus roseus TaxID=4058 RepID=A0ACC0CBV2_CATRO|nr:hypothetical protein M9H77_03644 [Catharanthus roseus]
MSGFMKSSLPSSRGIATKHQISTYKGWPKKNDTPKVPFKDNSKPKYNGAGHINCPTKKTLIFCEDLNGWIEKDEEDCLEDIIDEKDSQDDEVLGENYQGMVYSKECIRS